MNAMTVFKLVGPNGVVARVASDRKKYQVIESNADWALEDFFTGDKAEIDEELKTSPYRLEPDFQVGIYYFTLNTGESLAVSSDDKVAALNGSLLTSDEYQQILHLINAGHLSALSSSESPVSMLREWAKNAEPAKPFNKEQDAEVNKALESINRVSAQKNAPDLSGLSPYDDEWAIKVLKTSKREI